MAQSSMKAGGESSNARATALPEPVVLIIADISGYTRYMTANAKTLSHSHTIITELVEALVAEVELPFEVAKLEGDAVFLFCRKNGSVPWAEVRRTTGQKLLRFFEVFSGKLAELSASATCTCNACAHIERLRLKLVVHSGVALFHRVLNFTELAGVDVIIVHRLLKNSIHGDQYLLVTEAARSDLEFPASVTFEMGSEVYEGIGRVNTLVYLPEPGQPGRATPTDHGNWRMRPSGAWRFYLRLWFAPLKLWPPPEARPFRNVMETSAPVARFGLAVLTLVLSPVMVPVGALFVLWHGWRRGDSSGLKSGI